MEILPQPATISINGETFDIVKPSRLLPGMVLRSQSRKAYARLGPKESALQEHIHTVSLRERGFPVAQVLESGEYGTDQWYFIEESLGEETFHDQFAQEYEKNGAISDETFKRYSAIVQQYASAQFNPNNRTAISAAEFVEATIPDSSIVANYAQCGKDVDRYHEAIAAATTNLADAQMGVVQYDLNPFNILEHGMIDFELVGYGPLGYDTSLVSLWHRWFASSGANTRYTIAYYLSEAQIAEITHIIDATATQYDVPSPHRYMQEFLLIKTAWGFSSTQDVYENPTDKQAFYRYRAGLLEHCVESYLHKKPIDPLGFPEMHS